MTWFIRTGILCGLTNISFFGCHYTWKLSIWSMWIITNCPIKYLIIGYKPNELPMPNEVNHLRRCPYKSLWRCQRWQTDATANFRLEIIAEVIQFIETSFSKRLRCPFFDTLWMMIFDVYEFRNTDDNTNLKNYV